MLLGIMGSINANMISWKKRLPMWLTWSRMGLVPFILVLVEFWGTRGNLGAALLFIVASLTDYGDGYFARKYDALSPLGKFMDPVADKILVTSILVYLTGKGQISSLLVIIILTRDLLIGGLRSVAAANQVIISAKPTGKWKTALQMIAIPVLIASGGDQESSWFSLSLSNVGHLALWFSVVLSLVSGFEYLVAYSKQGQ